MVLPCTPVTKLSPRDQFERPQKADPKSLREFFSQLSRRSRGTKKQKIKYNTKVPSSSSELSQMECSRNFYAVGVLRTDVAHGSEHLESFYQSTRGATSNEPSNHCCCNSLKVAHPLDPTLPKTVTSRDDVKTILLYSLHFISEWPDSHFIFERLAKPHRLINC